jgi:spore maturation protein CgeB
MVDYIYSQLQKYSNLPTELHICESVEDVILEPHSLVYVAGLPFKKFSRTKTCKYVSLNFSVLYVIGNPLKCSISAFNMIRRKRKIFEDKLECFDYVLDYWTEHTAVMQKKISLPVKTFPLMVDVKEQNLTKASSREYDVCFVGTMTPRRIKILKELERLGITTSPISGVILEEEAAKSKIVLNVHARRSTHLELPRIIGAFASKAALITEQDSALEKFCPSDTYVATKYNNIVSQIQFLLNNPASLDEVAEQGHEWLLGEYSSKCEEDWKDCIQEIQDTLVL